MNKINLMILIFPMFINLMILLIMMFPSKINKFHPISLMMILITLTLLICLKINFIKKSLISFILFLIMIGGLMIIFMYITSLSNNELFSFNLKILFINLLKILPFILIFLFFTQYIQLMMNENNSLIEFSLLKLNLNNNLYMNMMYKEFNNKSTYFIMLYLYYSMICIMNICYKMKTPLRQLSF